MGPRNAEGLLASTPKNAIAGWFLLLFLCAIAAGSFLDGDLAWGVFVLGVLVLCGLPPVAFRDPQAMLPWEVVAMATLPVFGRAIATFELASDLWLYLSIAALALIVAVELDLFTRIKLTVGFAIVFVVLATLAAAGLWAVFRWSLDVVIGTEFLLQPGVDEQVIHDDLMIEFLYSAVAGVAAGVVFELYFRRRVSPDERIPEELVEK
jgi:hypothetical protein